MRSGICARKCDVPLRQPVCPCSIFDARSVTIVALRSGPVLSATKILWGQILVVSVIVLAAIWGATQWTAWRLGYQPRLGQPWAELGGMPVYPPPAFFVWWYWFDDRTLRGLHSPGPTAVSASISGSASCETRSKEDRVDPGSEANK